MKENLEIEWKRKETESMWRVRTMRHVENLMSVHSIKIKNIVTIDHLWIMLYHCTGALPETNHLQPRN